MNMDTITLKFQSVISKMKNDLSSVIGQYTKLDNTLNKVSNTMNKISKDSNMSNSFAGAKQQIKDLEIELKSLTKEYTAHAKAFSNRFAGASYGLYNPDSNKLAGDIDPNKTIVINQEKLNEEKARIDELQAKINELKSSIEQPVATKELVPRELVPKANEGTKKIKEIGDEAKNTGNKFNSTKIKARQMSLSFSNIGKSFKGIGNRFKDVGNGISKNMDKGLRSLKKFTLGLVGVRTVMSLLTKAVHAYLSFDSDLQDSLTNSWNMLGSLLAPAIELVANLFATATNYVYRFIQALTGIDLVARANAKALQTQAKATQSNAAAQRGLLSMDEITNLPTESGGGSGANQIKVPEIDASDIFSKLIELIKKGDWYGVGKYIAEKLNSAMESIPWDKIRKTASNLGTNIAKFLNGGIENFDWHLLGETLGQGINTAIDFSYSFISEFNWKAFGDGIANYINGAFETIDWAKLGKTISDGFKGLLSTLNTILTKTDWKQIGESIRELLMNIDWVGIAKDILKVMYNAIKGESNFLDGLLGTDENPLAKLNKYQMGGGSLLFVDSLEQIKQYMNDPETFAIDKMEKYGSTVDGIKDKFKGVFDKLSEFRPKVEEFFLSIDTKITNFKEKIGEAWDKVKEKAISKFNEIKNGIKDILIKIGNKAGETIGNAFKSVINGVLGAIEKMLNTPIRAINKLVTEINKIPGVHMGKLGTFSFPRLATGTNEIEAEGLYHLHEGEAVVPKKYNPVTGGYDNGADNKQIIDLLISLNSSLLEYADRPIDVNIDGRKVAEATYNPLQQIDKNRNASQIMTRS